MKNVNQTFKIQIMIIVAIKESPDYLILRLDLDQKTLQLHAFRLHI